VKNLMGHLEELGRLPDGVQKTDPIASRPAMAAAGYFHWSAGPFEAMLLAAGAAPYFVDAIEEIWPGRLNGLMNSWGASVRDDPAFLQRATSALSKPQIVRRVAEMMAAATMPVPAEIEELLSAVAERALMEARIANPISVAPPLAEPESEEATAEDPEPD